MANPISPRVIAYDASSIKALKGLEPIRKRPGMYVADTGAEGVLQLTKEVIDNAVDEFQAGHGNSLRVEVWTKGDKKNQVRVTDEGRGIPVDKHESGLSALEVVLTQIHAGGKFDEAGGAYKTSAGLHGVGIKATNALSEFLHVTVERDGGKYVQEYKRGVPVKPVKRVGDSKKRGTTITFKHDPIIFLGIDVDPEAIKERLEEVAYLCSGLSVYLSVDGHEVELTKTGGIYTLLKRKIESDKIKAQHKPVYFSKQVECEVKNSSKKGVSRKTVIIEMAFAWTQGQGERWTSFVNVCHVPEGGTQVNGAKLAIAELFSDMEGNSNIPAEYFRDGLYVVCHVRLDDPIFKSQAKVRLLNPEIRKPGKEVMLLALKRAMKKFPDLAQQVSERARMLKMQREKLTKSMEAIRNLDFRVKRRGLLPEKLAEAPMASPKEREIYIVEGDSAGGTAKEARNSSFQEVLALRGKVLNAARSEIDVVFKNKEYKDLVTAIGCGVDGLGIAESEKCDPESRGRIQAGGTAKICLLMDADPDGKHIASLVLTFIARFMRPLLEHGLVYVVDSPLYVGVWKDKRAHGHTKAEVRKKFPENSKPMITYLKGHGEASADQLHEYAFSNNRRLIRLTLEDAGEADSVLGLMGDDVEGRKKLLGFHK